MNVTFSRRSFLKTLGIGAIAASIPATFYSIAHAQTAPRNAGYYRFKLGTFNLMSLSDGILTAPAAAFAGNATPEQLQAALKEGFQSETLTPDCNILLIDTGTQKVLIDSGSGNLNGATAGKLIENMTNAGVKPADITAIIITHAHADHVGGFTDPMGTLLFPNAQYYVPNAEWQFWMNPNVSLPKVQLPDDVKKGFIDIAKKQLTSIQNRVTKFEMNREILPGITAIPTPGHTAGHVAIQIQSGDAKMIHTADVVHIQAINLRHPSWKPVFDADPEQAATTRQNTLAKIASDRTLMFAYHFPFPGMGHIVARETEGFDWEPVNWQFES